MSRPLARFRELGLGIDRCEGFWIYYRINSDLPAWLKGVLRAPGEGLKHEAPFVEDAAMLTKLVVGDGRLTIPELIDRLPRSSKDRARLKIAAQNRVPADGGLVELGGSGKPVASQVGTSAEHRKARTPRLGSHQISRGLRAASRGPARGFLRRHRANAGRCGVLRIPTAVRLARLLPARRGSEP